MVAESIVADEMVWDCGLVWWVYDGSGDLYRQRIVENNW